jgi:methionyl-tRNA formyltransferase
MTVRVVFLGNDPWSVPALEALAAAPDVQVGLVLTNPPRPAGRGSRLRPTRVADAASRLNLSLAEVDGIRGGAGLDAVGSAAADVLVVVAYGQLLPQEVLEIAPRGAVNVHFSLLPRWRGAAPVQRALLAGDPVTGVTVMLMDAGLDTGPVLAVEREPVREDDDAGSLGSRLAERGGRLLVAALRSLVDGTAAPRPQDSGLATSAPKLAPEERWISWDEPAEAVVRRVRALSPDPGASTRVGRRGLKVFRAEVAEVTEGAEGGTPGKIIELGRERVVVAAGPGAVRLLEVAASGRRRMSAADWARGARLVPGDSMG